MPLTVNARHRSLAVAIWVFACGGCATRPAPSVTPFPITTPATRPASRPASAVFRAGAATSDITPMLGGAIVGNFVEPAAVHVHDDLHARCLVLDDGTTRVALAICDNVGIGREAFDEAKRLIFKSTGIPPACVLASSTHTHSATSARSPNVMKPEPALSEYEQFVARRIADGVRRAIANLEPAEIGFGSVEERRPIFNRRYRFQPGTELLNPLGGKDQVRTNPSATLPTLIGPAGPTDPELSFLAVRSAAAGHRPIAVLANYSLHYIGGVPDGVISADYYGAFADKIQARLKADRLDPPFVGILSNGTSGDVNNIDVMGARPAALARYAAMSATRAAAATRPELATRPYPQFAPATQPAYEKMNVVADWLAEDVTRAMATTEFRAEAPLKAVGRELVLKVRRPTPEQVERARQVLAGRIKPKVPNEAVYAKRTMLLDEAPAEVSVPLQAISVGGHGIAAVPFEMFAAAGMEIKARSPAKPTFVIELANGGYGYLPTAEQHALGGYETWLGTDKVEVDASTKIVDTLVELLGKLQSP